MTGREQHSPADLGARQAAAQIATGALSVEQLVAACLERIAQREDQLLAWAQVDESLARRQARAADAAGPRAPLYGVPVGVKDIIDTADQPTEYGSPIYRGHRPAADAACVRLVRERGGLVLGKTASTEFAHMHPAPTGNPHHPAHTPGGSSSGSAAAVSAGMVPLALGSQTGGSVIRPATFCGVAGFKPSYGAVPIAGTRALGPSLDTLGFFARSVTDLRLLAAALMQAPTVALSEPGDGAATPRLGLLRTHRWAEVEPDAQALLEAVCAGLRPALDTPIRELDTSVWFAALDRCHATIMDREVDRATRSEQELHGEQLSEEIRAAIVRGRAVDEAGYAAAQRQARSARERTMELFDGVDAILCPAAPGAAPADRSITGDPAFNRIWTLLGTPCITVPAGASAGGLPIGIQLTAPYGQDERLLQVAEWVERRITAAAETAPSQ